MAGSQATARAAMEIRPYRRGELARVVEIFRANEPAMNIGREIGDQNIFRAGELYVENACANDDLASEEAFGKTYAAPGQFWVAVDAEGTIQAQVALQDMGGGVGQLRRMGVMTPARRNGLGSTLVQTLIAHAWGAAGMHRIVLTTLEHNDKAIRMYERCGFRVARKLFYELKDASVPEGFKMCASRTHALRCVRQRFQSLLPAPGVADAPWHRPLVEMVLDKAPSSGQ